MRTVVQKAHSLLRGWPQGEPPTSERLMVMSHIMRRAGHKQGMSDTPDGHAACVAALESAKVFKLAAWIVANREVS